MEALDGRSPSAIGGDAEGELVARAQGGDSAAFADLYRLHFDSVLRRLELRLGNADDADELAQQVFVRLLERLPQYDADEGPFGAWLFTLVQNIALDRIRRESRVDVTDPETMAALQESRRGQPGESRGPLDAEVARLVDRLPKRQRRVLLLTYGMGFRATEIAAILGTSPDAVRHVHQRTLRTLSPRLARLR